MGSVGDDIFHGGENFMYEVDFDILPLPVLEDSSFQKMNRVIKF